MRTRVIYNDNWKKETMTKNEFCWWLHGFMEIAKPEALTEVHVKEIKNHLALCNSEATSLNLNWYPESLRKWNESHPESPLIC